jgi:hypothetical protein
MVGEFKEIDPLSPPGINEVQPDEGFWKDTPTAYFRAVTGKTDERECHKIKITANGTVKIIAAAIDVY